MQEFMFLIRNEGDEKSSMTTERHDAFVRECEVYIGNLKKNGKLIAAQPLDRSGVIVSGSQAAWKEIAFDPSKTIQVGYYHILAESLTDAVAIAKDNPEFAYSPSASIEVRPIKTSERSTGFVYPK